MSVAVIISKLYVIYCDHFCILAFSFFQFTVTAYDNGNPQCTRNTQVTINIERDTDDPFCPRNNEIVSTFDENTANGTQVYRFVGQDNNIRVRQKFHFYFIHTRTNFLDCYSRGRNQLFCLQRKKDHVVLLFDVFVTVSQGWIVHVARLW